MPTKTDPIATLDIWYARLKRYQDKLPSKGSIAAALQVLNRCRAKFDLEISSHIAPGGSQIIGLSGAAIAKILREFGETRTLSAVAGRSNRGARGDISALLSAINELNLKALSEPKRNEVLTAMQRHVVTEYVARYFAVRRVKATFDHNAATWCSIRAILDNARASGKAGAVAEYLVGAKLSLRFPEKDIRNKGFTTSDAQGGFSGDFEIGNTAFHVTMAPMSELIEKCKANLENGLRVYLLVPESQLQGTRQNAELLASGRMAVESIESFVATNIDEQSEFDGSRLKSGFRRLLETYNRRVNAVETDKSLLIDIPPNLD